MLATINLSFFFFSFQLKVLSLAPAKGIYRFFFEPLLILEKFCPTTTPRSCASAVPEWRAPALVQRPAWIQSKSINVVFVVFVVVGDVVELSAFSEQNLTFLDPNYGHTISGFWQSWCTIDVPTVVYLSEKNKQTNSSGGAFGTQQVKCPAIAADRSAQLISRISICICISGWA